MLIFIGKSKNKAVDVKEWTNYGFREKKRMSSISVWMKK